MKTLFPRPFHLLTLAILCFAAPLHATNLTWDFDTATTGAQDGVGIWTNALPNINWWDGAANVTWNNLTPDNATFGAGSGAAGIVTVPNNTTNTVGNITFNAPGSGSYTLAAGSSTSSKLNLSGTPIITVASGVTATNLVVLTGTSFTKLGAGTFVLKPGAANTNSGSTVVGNGTLIIGATTGRLLIPGNLTITNGAIALMGASEQIADSAIITVDGGTYDSGGKSETVGGFVLDNNGQVLSASSSQAITNNGTAYDLRSGSFFPNLAGTAGLNKTTAGTVIITNGSGTDTFTGPVLVSAGILDLGHSSSSGNFAIPATTVTITNTGMVRSGKDTQFHTNAIVNVASGTWELFGHNDTVSALILDNGGQILNGGSAAKTLTVLTNMDFRNGICSTKLIGAGVMTKSTTGTAILAQDNANTGGTFISAGILQLGDGTSTNRGQFGLGPVTNNAAIVLNHTGAFSISNTISGSGSLTNLGGSPSLYASNSYSGNTAVNAGTLFAKNSTGSATGSGTVLVFGGTLAGSGIIGGLVNIQSSGTLAPGNSAIGTLTISNTLTLGGNTIIEVNKGVGQDLVAANSVNYGGTLTVTDLGLNLVAGDTFQIFNVGSHTGNFASLSGSPGGGLNWSFNAANGVLSVVSAVVTPPTLVYTNTGSGLQLSWTGSFKLQAQTNSLATGLYTNWADYPGGSTSPVSITNSPTNPTMFFRLATP